MPLLAAEEATDQADESADPLEVSVTEGRVLEAQVAHRSQNQCGAEADDDPIDKRAKRIKVTELGRKELNKYLPLMHEVFKQMTGDMNRAEKLHFIAALREINDFHSQHDKH